MKKIILTIFIFSFLFSQGQKIGYVNSQSIFALNGVGFLAFESIQRQDFPVVQSIVVMLSFVYIILTFCSDIINAQLDPRIRLS